ncbi:hypothetical protein B0A48_05921 [Cryoendolithus antarcticus]|uniref:F-box domain-containing protein n=1 Tax=Cryoendolithus antarcticus TaxID=1507870 RepID=A0A1V8TCC8_9PEZI|nr:hypothetical protein B0A48_05921 [Cryoendolithus antarcticus]
MSALPDEILLNILAHTDSRTIFTSVLCSSKKLHRCSLSHMTNVLLPQSHISATFTLGRGSQHRWYDIRTTLNFHFSRHEEHNTALYHFSHVHPEHCIAPALEKWRHARTHDREGKAVLWRAAVESESKPVLLASAVVVDAGVDAGHESLCISLDWMELLKEYYVADRVDSWDHCGDGRA